MSFSSIAIDMITEALVHQDVWLSQMIEQEELRPADVAGLSPYAAFYVDSYGSARAHCEPANLDDR